jgi:hypothetical protein
LFIAAVAAMTTAPIAAALSFLLKPRDWSNVTPELLPTLAFFVMMACYRIHQNLSSTELGQSTVNLGTVGFMLGSWLFAIISLISLVVAFRAVFDRELSLMLRAHSLAVSISCAAIAVYLSWWGVIGLRLWDS